MIGKERTERTKEIVEYVEGIKEYHTSTINNNLNYLTRCEYLKKLKLGVYIKCAHIPTDLTSNLLVKMAYNDQFKLSTIRKFKINQLLGKNDNLE